MSSSAGRSNPQGPKKTGQVSASSGSAAASQKPSSAQGSTSSQAEASSELSPSKGSNPSASSEVASTAASTSVAAAVKASKSSTASPAPPPAKPKTSSSPATVSNLTKSSANPNANSATAVGSAETAILVSSATSAPSAPSAASTPSAASASTRSPAEQKAFELVEKITGVKFSGKTVQRRSKSIIIGAGFGGIASAIKLLTKFNTRDFVIYSNRSNFGGTWWSHTYPGCASDIPAPLYSLSTDLNPNWSRLNPPQKELSEYLLQVTEKYKLEKNTSHNSHAYFFDWNAKKSTWLVKIRDLVTGDDIIHESELVLMCQGGLVTPSHPNIEGLRTKFKGPYFHTAEWRNDVSLKDKDVIILGNGCSAAQIVPEIIDETKSLTQFCRSAQWMTPAPSKLAYFLFKHVFSRSYIGLKVFRNVLAVLLELRYPLFRADIPLFTPLYRRLSTFLCRTYVKRTAPAKYHQLVIPDFKLGCKRIVIDGGYLKSMHKPNFDLTADPVISIGDHEVHTKSGRTYHADVIIGATGYDILEPFHNYVVYGVNKSESMSEIWDREGISAYETTLVKGVPNFFFIGGPNHATGHSSIVTTQENVLAYFEKIGQYLLKEQAATVEVKENAYNSWHENVQNTLRTQVFGTEYGGCTSWYRVGGENPTAYPWSQLVLWWRSYHPHYNELTFKWTGEDQVEKAKDRQNLRRLALLTLGAISAVYFRQK